MLSLNEFHFLIHSLAPVYIQEISTAKQERSYCVKNWFGLISEK